MDAYKFPVMTMIINPSGKIIHTLNANDLLDASNKESEAILSTLFSGNIERVTDPVSFIYHQFLTEATEKFSNQEL